MIPVPNRVQVNDQKPHPVQSFMITRSVGFSDAWFWASGQNYSCSCHSAEKNMVWQRLPEKLLPMRHELLIMKLWRKIVINGGRRKNRHEICRTADCVSSIRHFTGNLRVPWDEDKAAFTKGTDALQPIANVSPIDSGNSRQGVNTKWGMQFIQHVPCSCT